MDSRLVECLDCGHQWESSSVDPRCSKAACGRSRDVEAVDAGDVQDAGDAGDDGGDSDVQDDVDDADDADDAGGYTPAFESKTVEKATADRRPTPDDDGDDGDVQDAGDDAGDGDLETADGQQPEAADADLPHLDPDQLKPALQATFGMAAANRGEHWELEDDEAQQLAEGWTPVINHYAPHVLRKHTEIGAAVVITYAVIGPKLAEDKRLAELEEKADVDDATGSVRQARVADDGGDELDLGGEEIEATSPADATAEEIGGYASV